MRKRQLVRGIIFNGDKVLAMKRNRFGDQYYTLIGGGIKIGEDLETALRRELQEETGLEVGAMRQVFVEDAGDFYGVQHIFLCEYTGGDPALAPDSDEALIGATTGQNTYEPVWLPLRDIVNVKFRSLSVAEAILEGARNGFPETPQVLVFKPERVAR